MSKEKRSKPASEGAHASGGLSVKVIAGIVAAAIVVGGAALGISSAVKHKQAPEPQNVEESGEVNIDETAKPEPEPTVEIELLGEEYVSQLPYTGDTDKCVLTVDQAEAYARIIDDCIGESEEQDTSYPTFCRTALFDAGDGVPALWVVEGTDMGYSYDPESGYMPSISRIYQWDGKQAVLAVDADAQNYILTDQGLLIDRFGPEWRFDGYSCSELYSLSGGLISEEPVHVYEHFMLSQEETPSEEALRAYIAEYGDPGVIYDYSTLSADMWRTPGYEAEWMIASLDGDFLPVDSAQALMYSAVTWRLGHGQAGHQDVSHTWAGDWRDGAKTAALLRGIAPVETHQDGRTISYDPSTHIRRTTLDPEGYNLELYFEIPVFEDGGDGYEEINAFFQGLEDEFFDEGDIASYRETASLLPQSDEFPCFYTYNACINDWTEKFVSVSLSYSWYMGGVLDYGTNNYNFRTDTGERLLLSDFIDGTETEVKDLIVSAIQQQYPGIDNDALNAIREHDAERFDFFISDGHVHVFFDKYEISYGAAGMFDVELPAELKADWT